MDLRLSDLTEVSSLSCFHQLPKLSESLTALMLERSSEWRMIAADFPLLFALRQLREPRLIDFMLTAADRAPFEQRPCAALPHLKVFEWMLPSD